jgi:hypothetical protein
VGTTEIEEEEEEEEEEDSTNRDMSVASQLPSNENLSRYQATTGENIEDLICGAVQ